MTACSPCKGWMTAQNLLRVHRWAHAFMPQHQLHMAFSGCP